MANKRIRFVFKCAALIVIFVAVCLYGIELLQLDKLREVCLAYLIFLTFFSLTMCVPFL